MLLFLLAAGLSLIYGLMRMLNLAHGSYYILGGYIGLAAMRATGSFVLAALAATAIVTLVGVVMERFFLRRFPEQELPQALLTFGFLLIFADLALWLWGGTPQTLPKPEIFERSIRIERSKISGFGKVCGVPPQSQSERSAKMSRNPNVSSACGSSCSGKRRRKKRSITMPTRVTVAVAATAASTKLPVTRTAASPT